jgi:nucleotide-binding universal stress UspA family protein
MPMISLLRDIHVVVDLDGKLRPVTVAAEIARLHEAHLTGIALAFQPIIPVYTVAPVPTDFIVSAQKHAAAHAKAATEGFEAIASAAGILFEGRSMESTAGDGFVGAVRSFRLSDLVVVGQQDPNRLEPMREGLIEALLFQAGVPVFLVPYSGTGDFRLKHVVIGWDGGAAAARAVRTSLPLLRQAETVQVVTIAEERKQSGIVGTDIGRYLARHDLDVEIRQLDSPTGDTAATLLDFATQEEADWIVMGAYGHSRMREFFLGGVTRGILSSATVPVYMAH